VHECCYVFDGILRHIDPRQVIADLQHVINDGQALTKIGSRFTIECHLRKKGKPGYAAQQYLRSTAWMREVETLLRTGYPTVSEHFLFAIHQLFITAVNAASISCYYCSSSSLLVLLLLLQL
jgi:hypothetical protein